MTPALPGAASPARRHALQVLLQSDTRRPGSKASAKQGSEFPEADERVPRGGAAALEPRDRALAERLIKGVQRRRALLDALLLRAARTAKARFEPTKTPAANLWILRLAAFEKIFQGGAPDYAIGMEAVELARATLGEPAGRFTNAMLRRVFPHLPADAAALLAAPWYAQLPAPERLSIPAEIIMLYEAAYGAAAPRVLESLATADAGTWLRVNTLKTSVEAARAELTVAGVETELAPGELPALLWTGGAAPWSAPGWAAGQFIVQDLAAQLASILLAPQPGETVLDLCAAPGGKATHLWELMQGAGRLIAWEIDPQRRKLLAENITRLLGPSSAIEIPAADSLAALQAQVPPGSCDALLIDAPCQAFGLIRRHPEVRWDGRLATQPAICRMQQTLLATAAPLVRPGGRLLWVTCSPTLAENEGIITPFLAANPDWQLADPPLPTNLEPVLSRHARTLRTRPDAHLWDAFAYTLLLRKP